MRLIGAIVFLAVGCYSLYRMANRDDKPTSPLQASIDFATGAPMESVLTIGSIIFGVILFAAHFLAG